MAAPNLGGLIWLVHIAFGGLCALAVLAILAILAFFVTVPGWALLLPFMAFGIGFVASWAML